MRLKARDMTRLSRIHVRPADFKPAEYEDAEFDDPHTFALVTAFRRAHGESTGATTVIHLGAVPDRDAVGVGARAT